MSGLSWHSLTGYIGERAQAGLEQVLAFQVNFEPRDSQDRRSRSLSHPAFPSFLSSPFFPSFIEEELANVIVHI